MTELADTSDGYPPSGPSTGPDASPPPEPPTTGTSTTSSAPELLWVETWPDDPAALSSNQVRHSLRSSYVEEFWLPVLGPSTVLLLRMVDNRLDRSPAGFTLDVDATARELGIGHRQGRNSPMARTIQRCCSFGVARIVNGHQLLVHRTLPALTSRQVNRLPDALRARHNDVPPPATSVADLRSRCRVLARSLLELGEDPIEAERQLHRWHFHPAMAHEAVSWAARHTATGNPTDTSAATAT